MVLFIDWKKENEETCSNLFEQLIEICEKHQMELLDDNNSFDSFLQIIYKSMNEQHFNIQPFYEPTIYEMDVLNSIV
jgi:hypothetical protein